MTASKAEDRAAHLKDEAFEWLIRLNDTPDAPGLREEFEHWLARSPAHAEVWDRACAMWASMGEAEAHLQPSHVYDPTAPHARPQRRWISGAVAGIAAAVCLAYIAGPALLLQWSADYRTRTAETREVILEDGSRIELGPESAFASEFTAGSRTVRLLAGEIYLDIVHDPSRPFHVVSRDLDVRVLGTAFNVRVSEEGTQVGLERGEIEARGAVAGHAIDETLAPGDLVSVDRRTGETRREAIAPDAIGAWRSQRLIVSDATIGSVIEQIGRYHPSWIVAPDQGFADRRVTGIFTLADPDKALLALVAPHGGKVRKISPYMRVVTGF